MNPSSYAYLSPVDWFYAILSAFIGASLGFIISYLIIIFQRNRELGNLRNHLIQAFEFNIKEIDHIVDQINNKEIPNYLLDTASINHILFSGRNLFKNREIFRRFNWERYQLEHINNKIDHIVMVNFLLFAIKPNNDVENQARKEMVSRLLNRLVEHLLRSQADVKKLIEEFEKSSW